jgi:TPR repeat protein
MAGLVAGVCAGLLVIAFWPRFEPSSASVRALVEQPVFVAQPLSPPAVQRASPIATRGIAKEALNKLASALRGPSADQRPIASLAIPIDDARRLCAEGLIAFAKGDIATARAFLKRAAEGGDPRALMALGDTYDPTTLARLGALGLKGDEAAARDYYSRALAAGVGGARERIAALAAK